jgi:class 3 adenylate cyclase/pimeloyl-ACP methyl ester carboxylesterase
VEPQIRYAKTSDGVNIAYWRMGTGAPLVITPPLGYSHISLELQYPPLRMWYERLAERRTVVRFDWRAQGLSQRGVPAPPEFWGLLDLTAVIGALPVEQVDLMGCGASGFSAAAYASAQPDRVRKLILWSVPADGSAWGVREVEVATSLAKHDYRMFTETLAASILGWDDPASAHAWAQFIRRAMNERDHHTFFDTPATRVSWLRPEAPREVVAKIVTATLVIHPAGFRNMPVQNGQELASAIPNARLVVTTEERSGLPSGEETTAAIETFLDGAVRPRRSPPEARPASTAIILFADVVDSTALTERMGDAAFRERARALDVSLREIITDFGGAVIDAKTLGDGVLATFLSASQAIDAALRCGATGGDAGLPLHIGVHAGDVIREQNNVFGGAVNIAARISALSAPGEVLVSRTVADLARTSAGVTFEDRGDHALKGIDDPQRVFAVRSAAR